MRSSASYIIWDWNGTLLDDTQAALDTLNIMLARRGVKSIGMDFYRAHFAFPVRTFYASIGFALEREDWDALAREYHTIYDAQPKGLNREALAALEAARAHGCRQSILSILEQRRLEEITARLGVAPYMDRICGSDNLNGASKTDCARVFLNELDVPREEIVLIGDSLHDWEVAETLNVRCVLCAQGSHAANRLSAVAPTGATLTEAVRLAIGCIE